MIGPTPDLDAEKVFFRAVDSQVPFAQFTLQINSVTRDVFTDYEQEMVSAFLRVYTKFDSDILHFVVLGKLCGSDIRARRLNFDSETSRYMVRVLKHRTAEWCNYPNVRTIGILHMIWAK